MSGINDLKELVELFADFVKLELKLSQNTINSYVSDIKIFLSFLESKNISLTNFTNEDVRLYFSHCYNNGKSPSTVWRITSTLRAYVKLLRYDDYRDDDPLEDLVKPKVVRKLPNVINEKQVDKLLAAPDVSTYVGCRDKAMLELLYATGLRVSELCNIRFDDLHLKQYYIQIRGKGDKERIIPLVESAVNWLEHYIKEARPLKDPERKSEYVFISQLEDEKPMPMSRINFWMRVKKYAKDIGLKREPSPHAIRHAFATHLLNHDADLRSIQIMLGHASLRTTEIYTHVALERMHKVYRATHPRA